MEPIKNANQIPLEEFQELILLREDQDAFDKKLWEVTYKYQIPYVKILTYFKELTTEVE
ncbi:hypothetical protein M0R04_08850 [Candidatus Dojkabacteria bacterium]|nr:hypothetical protein [Candidatus Dojkabacteria bacterium]